VTQTSKDCADVTFHSSNHVTTESELPQPESGGAINDDFYNLSRWADDGGRNISLYATIVEIDQEPRPAT
jgi:hypothetical protein